MTTYTTNISTNSSSPDVLVPDSFWTDDMSVLFRKDRLTEFWITKDMTINEKLNAIARLSILSSIILVLYKGKAWPLYIGILGLLSTFILH